MSGPEIVMVIIGVVGMGACIFAIGVVVGNSERVEARRKADLLAALKEIQRSLSIVEVQTRPRIPSQDKRPA